MRSDRLSLVYTDSPCLNLALSEKGSLSRDEYLVLAHTNSESYMTLSGSEDKITISRTQKLGACRQEISRLLMQKDISTLPEFIHPYKKYIDAQKIESQEQVDQIVTRIVPNQSWIALFEIKKDGAQ